MLGKNFLFLGILALGLNIAHAADNNYPDRDDVGSEQSSSAEFHKKPPVEIDNENMVDSDEVGDRVASRQEAKKAKEKEMVVKTPVAPDREDQGSETIGAK